LYALLFLSVIKKISTERINIRETMLLAMKEPYVVMKDIHKTYPDGTTALRGVNLEIFPGEILGLLGENGAGKSTLMKILSGFIKPTKGEIYVEGKRVKFSSSRDALARGIAIVHQVFTLVPNMTALENIILGTGKGSEGILQALTPLDFDSGRRQIEELTGKLGLKIPLDTPVESLSLGERQRIEIIKALSRGTKVLILDEPTTFLTPMEVSELFNFVRRFKEQGGSVVFITHKIKEALEITDRIVVLRKGAVAGQLKTGDATPEKLAELMVGKEVDLEALTHLERRTITGETILKVEELWVNNDMGVPAVKGVSFEVRAGEVFGIAGVEGNGQNELIEAVTGLRKIEKGKVYLNGREVTNRSVIEMYKSGLSHIPGDRERYGLILDFTVMENSIIGRQWEPSFLKGSRIDWEKVRRYTEHLVARFNVVAPSIIAPAKSLSGGNRQKLLVGRELSRESSLIVAVHPTKGLDIASTLYVRELLLEARNAGKAVLLVSADLEEILQLSDGIAVMYEGKLVAQGKTSDFTLEEIGMLMGGVALQKAPKTT
jgi:simple sugar transport system ATP-binding protein